MTLPETIPLLGLGWNDLLFLTFAGIMVGSALLVVLMRDIIRCGLAMIICFAALAGLYVFAGATVVAAAQVLVYIGAISVLVLFAIMLTQTKSGPASLVFQTQAFPAAIAAAVLAMLIAVVVAATDWPGWPSLGRLVESSAADVANRLFAKFMLPFEVVSVLLLAAVIGGVFIAKRERGGERLMLAFLDNISASLDAYLVLSGLLFAIGSFGFLARRNAISMLMSIELMLNAVNLAVISFGAFTLKLNVDASVIALIVMASAAAEATVGLALVIAIFRNKKTPLVDEYDAMSQ